MRTLSRRATTARPRSSHDPLPPVRRRCDCGRHRRPPVPHPSRRPACARDRGPDQRAVGLVAPAEPRRNSRPVRPFRRRLGEEPDGRPHLAGHPRGRPRPAPHRGRERGVEPQMVPRRLAGRLHRHPRRRRGQPDLRPRHPGRRSAAAHGPPDGGVGDRLGAHRRRSVLPGVRRHDGGGEGAEDRRRRRLRLRRELHAAAPLARVAGGRRKRADHRRRLLGQRVQTVPGRRHGRIRQGTVAPLRRQRRRRGLGDERRRHRATPDHPQRRPRVRCRAVAGQPVGRLPRRLQHRRRVLLQRQGVLGLGERRGRGQRRLPARHPRLPLRSQPSGLGQGRVHGSRAGQHRRAPRVVSR